ncbi:hypothetical protein ACWD5R_32050 [Streptomyces sp. NPDC002514]|uniref:hypothetical protein n=1 Tax=Streptomyces sp. NPDC001270 TaxID=3364554 RepID=UPI0036CB627A
MDTLLVWGGMVSFAGGLLAVAWHLIRGAGRLGRRIDQFIDDWQGEPARPGLPARPGVMERMSGMEDRLTRVEHELYPNSGGSLRDAVDLANHRLALLCTDSEAPSARRAAGTNADDLHDGADGNDDARNDQTDADSGGGLGLGRNGARNSET